MKPDWIKVPGLQLAIISRPRGGDWLLDDLRNLNLAGIDVLVSLLTKSETEELGLSDERQACERVDITFLTFPIEDRSVPSSVAEFSKFTDLANTELKKRRGLGIHCRAGIGRSSLFAACLLSRHGYTPDEAFGAIVRARGYPVPDTDEQRQWVKRWADSLSKP